MSNLTRIPTLPVAPKKKRVVAYARVSSGKEAMIHSLSYQISYYSGLIQANNKWLYGGVYTDEAISGTKDERPAFNRMIQNCKEGKVDLIITKSISRFARNTVTLLETIRMLTSINVEVYFEEQNIYTLSKDGEILLTFLASYAQEEAKSVSDNMKWRIKKNFEEGLPWGAMLYGYNVIENVYYVNKDEAEVVKLIYELYLSGLGKEGIARELNKRRLKTRMGFDWTDSSVRQILNNYDYTGNLLLQKTYREDFISKKTRVNKGEYPMYHVEGSHEAIIDLETWQKVQAEAKRRNDKIKRKENPSYSPFKGIIKCGNCGKSYLRKDHAYRTFWICATYARKGVNGCPAKRIDEEELMKVIDDLQSSTKYDKDMFIARIKEIRIYNDSTMKIIFIDGEEVIRKFDKHSRKNSWTPEMKEKARLREKERQEKLWQK